jgi:aspartyl-tRNA(Asn)/glutamyl-tRNA(Gln) amidotransferase subunit A
MQLVGRPFDEATIITIGSAFQRATDFHKQCPELA